MKNYFFTFLFVAVAGIFSVNAQVTGKWKTIDDKTGDAKSIVEIYEQNGKIYGKVVEILNPARKNSKCDKCDGADKGKPIEGLIIIKGLKKDGDKYTDGDILDPQKGKLYSCTIKLDGKDKLDVRGYMGISMLGRTQVWHRVK
ncbi:DUF2147 domain-containing protein [Flavobacterium cerinum]|jgi:uncharacterized protein (DUF2147 family)|uniref:DUF2147 domain-containing protein n=1 Tax=Flavobacterium cerinum TaxID=2502784 RepID=A0A3S3QKA6_9FLAO|nr:DUF2147 domain-containing protein [Flavobacterium cerinum]RWW98890.1 DUF2147 domain-containing protein [Flavobacterium cerinum]